MSPHLQVRPQSAPRHNLGSIPQGVLLLGVTQPSRIAPLATPPSGWVLPCQARAWTGLQEVVFLVSTLVAQTLTPTRDPPAQLPLREPGHRVVVSPTLTPRDGRSAPVVLPPFQRAAGPQISARSVSLDGVLLLLIRRCLVPRQLRVSSLLEVPVGSSLLRLLSARRERLPVGLGLPLSKTATFASLVMASAMKTWMAPSVSLPVRVNLLLVVLLTAQGAVLQSARQAQVPARIGEPLQYLLATLASQVMD